MNTYIALFRGINVGGKNTIKMKELVHLLEGLGLTSVRTYIQSGNVIFESEDDVQDLALKINPAIQQYFGFAPHVLVLDQSEFQKAIAGNPFSEAVSSPSSLHLGFLARPPEHPNLEELDRLKSESEQYHLTDRVFYLYAPEGIGRSKLAEKSEKLLGVPMTDRNWNTIMKIHKLINHY
jgi:uncharacterized protein (DUF1697 family)